MTLKQISAIIEGIGPVVTEYVKSMESRIPDTVAKHVAEAVASLPPGPQGEPGESPALPTITVEHDGERGVVIRMGESETRFEIPSMIYRGVYAADGIYTRGDTVTLSGSLWHCNEATLDKPGGESKAWTLAAKRGRDGKDKA